MAQTETHSERRGFEAQAKQLLKLMIHSLYGSKEIFLRELISNAADAHDKLRYESLTTPDLVTEEAGIWIDVDRDAKVLSIRDNGIGMTRAECIEHLGTIARSGTAEFLAKLGDDERKNAQLIGQFGVGFYSAFIVADKVEVRTRRAGVPRNEGVRWESEGEADYLVEDLDLNRVGTEVRLHVREDASEFLDVFRLREVIRRYSDHIAVPVHLRKSEEKNADFEVVNQAKALWTRSRTDITDDEYKQFYRHIAHGFDDPLAWSLNKVEGKLEYTSLLFIPKTAPFDLWQREAPRGLKLYVQRVFILDRAEQFLPLYLRFVKGVVDCADLPLNVSREILQQDKRVDTIRQGLAKRVLDMLKNLAKDDADAYQGFWNEFGRVLKEAPAEDFANRTEVAKLFRFATTHVPGDEKQNVSLDDYVSRMKAGQDRIYYVTGDHYRAAAASPHLEIFKKRGIEVLLCYDRIDEWVMSTLSEFDGKRLTDIARGDLGLEKIETPAEEKQEASEESASKAESSVIERIKEVLKDEVDEVRSSERLVDSPACLVLASHEMGHQMRRLLQQAGQEVPDSKPSLEINLSHALIRKLDSLQDEDRFKELALVLLEQSRLAEGEELKDPALYIARVNRLLLSLGS